jgi:3-dehydroquinate dehydratase
MSKPKVQRILGFPSWTYREPLRQAYLFRHATEGKVTGVGISMGWLALEAAQEMVTWSNSTSSSE